MRNVSAMSMRIFGLNKLICGKLNKYAHPLNSTLRGLLHLLSDAVSCIVTSIIEHKCDDKQYFRCLNFADNIFPIRSDILKYL